MEIKTIYLETYGCAANQNNSEILQGLLEQQGMIFVSKPELADLVILNTCIVKGPTVQRMVSRIKELSKQNLIVAGCMPDVASERIKKIAKKANPEAKISLIGTNHFHEIARVMKKMAENKETVLISQEKEIKLCFPKALRRKKVGITQISEGCLGNCAYCIVRFAKGNLFSYPQEKIIKNVQQDLARGCKEIWLTSQDNASYGIEHGRNMLPELLSKIINLPSRFQVRVGMMNPSSLLPFVDDIIEIYKNKKVKKFLHVPVQAGSDKILRLMNRGYSVNDFYEIVYKFRDNIPNITISTDIIVGFPGEDEKDFEKTLELIRKVGPEVLNISKFWAMPGTLASKMEQIPVKEQKKRAIEVMKLHKKCIKNK